MFKHCKTLFTLLALGALLVGQSTSAKENATGTREIADNVYSFSADGEYYSMFVVTDEGVMVFETANTTHSTAMLDSIRSITEQPVKIAFQSHNHWDHASGGKVFHDLGIDTLAHAEAAEWMIANPGQDMVPPKQTWDGSRKDYTLGGVTVELHYLGMNHGAGMTVFVLPSLDLAYIADIVTPNRLPFTVMPDFNPREWERSLSEILELDFERAVFSHNEHNEPLDGGTKNDVVLQLQFLRDLRAGFWTALKGGTNPMMIASALELPQYEQWVGYKEWLSINVWRIMGDEFMGPFPWRPAREAAGR